ncbi:hypothetical protein WN48_10090 [Eufriesea mexicana]|nr:hypothetical protein WN48_10090 [Eufriesea mexicana]
MDEIVTMTVPPTLPAKTQSRDGSQVARQTVSIRTVSSPPTAPLSTGAGATVFVGLAAPGADSSAACRRRIPEVQAANGYGKQSSVKSGQTTQNQHQQQYVQQQHQQQAAHVVKIKINPDGDKNGRVISTVRLTLDENVGHEVEKENGIACERSSKRDGGVVVSATNLVNEQRCGSAGAGDGCVRISVGSNAFERNNNNNNKDKRNRNDDSPKEDMVHRETSEPMNTSSSNNRSSACFYYNSYPNQLNGMVISSGQCSPSDTLDSGTCSDLDGTPPPLPKKKNASTVILASDQHNRTGSLTSSGAEVDSDDNESNISCDSLNGGELSDRIVDGDRSKYREANDTILNLNRLDLSDDHDERTKEESTQVVSTPDVDSNSCSSRASPSVSPSPSGASSLSKASSTPRIRSPDPVTEQNIRLSSPVVKECTYEERKQEQERLEQESIAGDIDTSVNPLTGKKYVYEYDRFYKFHVNELKGNNKDTNRGVVLGDKDTDECFAGYKILEKEAIRSAKGTVRGVKNRVRAGIATFLQKPSSQRVVKGVLKGQKDRMSKNSRIVGLDFTEYRSNTSDTHRLKNGLDRSKYREANDTILNLNRLDLSDDHDERTKEESTQVVSTPDVDSNSCSSRASPSVSPSPSGASSLSKASSTPRIRSPDPVTEQNIRLSSPVVKECTYEERKQEQERLEQESIAGDIDTSVNPLTGKKYVYEYDRFYKFHVNELKGNNKDTNRGVVLGDKDTDECFAGYKILEKEAIRSAKGTVRGVKNRVRAGIATFLQKPSSQRVVKGVLKGQKDRMSKNSRIVGLDFTEYR